MIALQIAMQHWQKTPNFNPALSLRGLAWLKLGEFQRAISDFDRALALEPDQTDRPLLAWGRQAATG